MGSRGPRSGASSNTTDDDLPPTDAPDDHLPAECRAPSCDALAQVRFMGLTPLCRRHGIKAHRRAMGNVIVWGAVFLLLGGALTLLGQTGKTLGTVVAGGGGLVLALTPLFWRKARSLERLEGSPPADPHGPS
jgi:hypothetical protein